MISSSGAPLPSSLGSLYGSLRSPLLLRRRLRSRRRSGGVCSSADNLVDNLSNDKEYISKSEKIEVDKFDRLSNKLEGFFGDLIIKFA